jgi:ankyrin repeat protein
MARLFLEKGAKIQYSRDDELCFHAIHVAQSAEMVQLPLDHGANPELPDCGRERPLHWYAHRNNVAAMGVVLQNCADVDSASGGIIKPKPFRTPRYNAAAQGVRESDWLGPTPLHLAARIQ